MRSFFILLVLLFTGPAQAQKISDPALKPYVELWQNDGVDSLRTVLPALVKKYPRQPEVIFFQAVFETDARRACMAFETVVKDHQASVFADASLFRLIQYDYAVGKYRVAQERAEQLKKQYPGSAFVALSEKMFAGLNKETSFKIEEKSSESSAVPAKGFRLQVGAFSQAANAEELRDKLKSAGYAPIEFSEKTVNDKKLILVWVGVFGSKEEAAKTGDVLKNKFKLTYTIVEK